MNQFPYLYPHSLSEVERLNEEELWQDNRDAEVSHTQLTEIYSDGKLTIIFGGGYEIEESLK